MSHAGRLVVLACAAAQVCCACAARKPAMEARLDDTVGAALARAPSPVAGVAVQVERRGEILLARAYGAADVAAGAPLARDAIFRVGSITKTFTAVTILELAEARKLSIDDSAALYVPALARLGSVPTLRHLLAHTSGLPSYTELPWFPAEAARAIPRDELVARVLSEPPAFEPGARFAYSNSGYYLLGIVAEQVSDRPFEELLRASVLAPLGLRDTRLCPDTQVYPRAARGHRREGDRLVAVGALSMQNPYAAGALCSTAADLARFGRALAEGRVVGASAWAAMTTPATLPGGRRSPYGLGLFVDDLSGHRRLRHPGGIDGFASHLAIYPDDGLVIAVLANSETDVPSSLADDLARVVLGVAPPVVDDLPITAEQARPLLGKYAIPELSQTLLISYDAGHLRVGAADDPRRGRPLRAQRDGSYFSPELRARFRFEVTAAGVKIEQDGREIAGQRVP